MKNEMKRKEIKINFQAGTLENQDGTFLAVVSMSGFDSKKDALEAATTITELIIKETAFIRKDGGKILKRLKTKSKLLALLAMGVLLSACGTTTMVNGNAYMSPIARNEARLIVERDESLLFLAAAARVNVNGKQVASLGRGGSVIHDVEAGKNTLSTTTFGSFGEYRINFDATAGQTYNFTLSPRSDEMALVAFTGYIGEAANASVSEQSGYFQLEMTNDKK